jgi:thiopeptide-type bacteriocin biosynthesis protein
MVNLATALAGSVPAGMRWLIDHANTDPAPVPDRAIVRQAIRLEPGDQAALQSIPGGSQIAAAWRTRGDAASAYAGCLATDAPHVRRSSAFGSLLHMHHIRAHGIDPAAERLCHRAARSVALSWTARHDTTEEAPQ